MKTIRDYLNIVTESNYAILYHYTSFDSICDILNSDTLGHPNKIGLSLSRNKNHLYKNIQYVRLDIDQTKLRQRVNLKQKKGDYYEPESFERESEEYINRQLPTLHQFLLSINISEFGKEILEDPSFYGWNFNTSPDTIRDCINTYCKKYNIDANI